MLDRFSRATVDDLRRVATTTRIMRRADYEEIIDDMAARLARIALNPGEREPTETQEWQRNHVS